MFDLGAFVRDFASALKGVDAEGPRFTSRSGRTYRPGIGPHAEDRAMDLIVDALRCAQPAQYASLACRVPYPSSRQACDLVVGMPPAWRIEVKMARLLGDNGKPDDTAIKDVLSPFELDRSAVADCVKLVSNSPDTRRAILTYGFNAPGKRVEQLIEAFEAVASLWVRLGRRHAAAFDGLVHPVHRDGAVFAWEVLEGTRLGEPGRARNTGIARGVD